MTISAAIVRELMSLGLSGDALLASLERIEAAEFDMRPARSAGAIRTERWRERVAQERASQSVTVTSQASQSVTEKEKVSRPLPKEKSIHSAPARGSRLPENFEPNAEVLVLAESFGFKTHEIQGEIDKFKDYWRQASGSNSVKRDWQAALRNWFRKANEYKLNRSTTSQNKPTVADHFAAFDRRFAAAVARADHSGTERGGEAVEELP